jgi:hypothetical protein
VWCRELTGSGRDDQPGPGTGGRASWVHWSPGRPQPEPARAFEIWSPLLIPREHGGGGGPGPSVTPGATFETVERPWQMVVEDRPFKGGRRGVHREDAAGGRQGQPPFAVGRPPRRTVQARDVDGPAAGEPGPVPTELQATWRYRRDNAPPPRCQATLRAADQPQRAFEPATAQTAISEQTVQPAGRIVADRAAEKRHAVKYLGLRSLLPAPGCASGACAPRSGSSGGPGGVRMGARGKPRGTLGLGKGSPGRGGPVGRLNRRRNNTSQDHSDFLCERYPHSRHIGRENDWIA